MYKTHKVITENNISVSVKVVPKILLAPFLFLGTVYM